MSKIEVDAIDKQSGSTLTLGGSGTAVTLACGATQTGFGRTGTVDWQTSSIKTATFTAVSGQGFFCDTASGSFEVDLPAGSAGAIVSIQDYNNTFDSNSLTVDPNGTEKINGGAAGAVVTLSTEGQGVTFVYIDATVGWRSVQDNQFSQAGTNPAFVAATGGTVTTVCTNFKVHTFTGPGTFCVSCAGNPAGSTTVSYMVVAGGGSGGQDNAGGGGGGGFRERKESGETYTASPIAGSAAVTISATAFPIAVGAGGAAISACSAKGADGSNSSFSSITSAGGGGGGAYPGSTPTTGNANAGGSGGGGYIGSGSPPVSNAGAAGNTPPVSPPQGQPGGTGKYEPGGNSGGAGGGATGAGGDSTASSSPGQQAGGGGTGATTSITGSAVGYAGGGGGGAGSSCLGGNASSCLSGGFGGGNSGRPAGGRTGAPPTEASENAGSAVANRGGGGGGANNDPGGSGAGGSGIVVIRYKFQ